MLSKIIVVVELFRYCVREKATKLLRKHFFLQKFSHSFWSVLNFYAILCIYIWYAQCYIVYLKNLILFNLYYT